jgi:hypothetical protein
MAVEIIVAMLIFNYGLKFVVGPCPSKLYTWVSQLHG